MKRYIVCITLLASSMLHAKENATPPIQTAEVAPSDLPDAPVSGEEVAIITDAPLVPPPITRDHPTTVKVELEVKEVVKRLADGVDYTFWTFGGSVPGKFIRVRQNDEIELTLKNDPANKMPHNIDLHAVTGPGGGAKSTFTAPGHQTTFSFKALNPGLFVYHCATAPVGMHIGNGMYGLILVEPKGGLPHVDKEFYVMQGDFYTTGKNGESGLQGFSMEKALDEHPEYVVFNGAVGALSGENALKAHTGETVRLFVGNGGPNLVSSFHVIGEIFDRIYPEGGIRVQDNVQTTIIPSGGGAICEMKLQVPGEYILVDHSIFRAFNKGALGILHVEGDPQLAIYSGLKKDSVYLPEGGAIQSIPSTTKKEPVAANKQERIAQGKVTFSSICAACHMPNGIGVPNAFPPLAGSDYLNEDKNRAIHAVLNGLQGEITVNGKKFNGVMPTLGLSNEAVANALTYVYSQWDNAGHDVTPEEVAKVRAEKK